MSYSLLVYLSLVGSVFLGVETARAEGGILSGSGEESKAYHWAVLVAGSTGFWNYRHQSDVCHAYQTLKAGGLPEDRIITMVYDDIADNEYQAPQYKGKLFNRPGGPDVYEGCAKDYTGKSVTAHMFYAVLYGNKEYVKGHGSERVVDSSPDDNIFIFYSDHGGFGEVEMPSGPTLWASHFIRILKMMHARNRYNEMLIYWESCESGSMFANLLPSDINVYAVSASNVTEDSWATYCPDYGVPEEDPVKPNPTDVGACLGDLFSVSWLEDAEAYDSGSETLHEQYVHVHTNTAATAENEYTGSEVVQFGTVGMDDEITGDFLSTFFDVHPKETPTHAGREFISRFPHLHESDPIVRNAHRLPWGSKRIRQRDADLVFFMHQATTAKDLKVRDEMLSELRNRMVDREQSDVAISSTVGALIDRLNLHHHAATLTSSMRLQSSSRNSHETGEYTDPVFVEDWDHLRMMLDTWESHCGKRSTYFMKYTRTFALLSSLGVGIDDLSDVASVVCTKQKQIYTQQPSISAY